MKKRIAILVSICFTTFSLCACSNSEGSSSSTSVGQKDATNGETYTLHAAYEVAENENSPHTIKMNKFKELVEERTDGKVQIMIHPGGELGSEKQNIEMLQNGELAFASTATSVLSGFTDALAFYDCPFLFHDQDQVVAFTHSDIAKERIDQLEEIGLVGLSASYAGSRNFLTVKEKPITCLADMKGLKLRTMQTEIQISGVEMLGAEATPLAYTECYQSMQTGVIDGMENESNTYLAMKFYEVAPNYTEAGWLQLVHMFIASKEALDELPEEYQKIIIEAGAEAGDYSAEKGIDYANNKAKEEMKAAGVNLIEVDNTEFREALEQGGLFDKYSDLIGQDVLDWIEQNSAE
ncbi:MAG: TRAP transporter substrate-binding protein [Clostridiales bacterium]|nr:TRAP transporter substrate-binding protein [Clostridiales bacterium]